MDLNNPLLTSSYTNFLTDLKARDERAWKMDFTGDTNIPTDVIRYNSTSDRFEKYNGSSWDEILSDIDSHVSSTSNPHSVTASQVGNTTAQWNANQFQGRAFNSEAPASGEMIGYDGTQWRPRSAAELSLATTASLSSHTGSTSNPHSVTAAQALALAISNNLSDLASASTARTNLGLGSLATLSSISDSNFTGQLSVAKGGTGAASAPAALTALGAAASGANSDITSMSAIATMERAGTVTVGPSNASALYLQVNNAIKWIVHATDYGFYPNASLDIGRTGNPVKDLYFSGSLVRTAARPNYSSFTYTTTRSVDPNYSAGGSDAANAIVISRACANVLNTLMQDLEDLGVINYV
jgi:hypothetical protein